jgi:hypothetical protein
MKLLPLLLLPLMLAVAGTGCARDADDSVASRVEGQVQRGLDEARGRLATEPMELHADGEPDAEIDPDGTFRVDGKVVATTPEQRALLQAYHGELVGIAEAGIAIGGQAAALAGTAVKEAIRGIFSGNPDDVEKRVEVEARKIEVDAERICLRVAALKQAQDRAAAAIPEFAPYATMTNSDVEECRADTGHARVELDVGDDGDADAASGDTGMDPAEEADAAAEAANESGN